jgi:succinate dehydrogenase flavin-adding protein (antitoxin of CptAB toxin-antitoxin module)
MATLYIRSVDTETARRLKANAALRGISLGQYLSLLVELDQQAIEWIINKESPAAIQEGSKSE